MKGKKIVFKKKIVYNLRKIYHGAFIIFDKVKVCKENFNVFTVNFVFWILRLGKEIKGDFDFLFNGAIRIQN